METSAYVCVCVWVCVCFLYEVQDVTTATHTHRAEDKKRPQRAPAHRSVFHGVDVERMGVFIILYHMQNQNLEKIE